VATITPLCRGLLAGPARSEMVPLQPMMRSSPRSPPRCMDLLSGRCQRVFWFFAISACDETRIERAIL